MQSFQAPARPARETPGAVPSPCAASGVTRRKPPVRIQWTEQLDAIVIRRNAHGDSCPAIARDLGCNPSAIRQRLRKLGVRANEDARRNAIQRSMRAICADPEYRAKLAERGAAVLAAVPPEVRKHYGRLAAAASHTPENAAKRAVAVRAALKRRVAARMAWLPDEYRKIYKLWRAQFGAAEARRYVEQAIAADRRKEEQRRAAARVWGLAA